MQELNISGKSMYYKPQYPSELDMTYCPESGTRELRISVYDENAESGASVILNIEQTRELKEYINNIKID